MKRDLSGLFFYFTEICESLNGFQIAQNGVIRYHIDGFFDERSVEMKKRNAVICGLIALLLLAAIAVCAVLLNRTEQSAGGMKLEKNTVSWEQEMKSANEAADIQIPYYSDIYMQGGSDEIEMYLVNPKENDCYFTYTLILKESGEQIYQSGLIEPGQAVDLVKLERKIESGEYALNMRIDTYTLETETPLNNAIVSTKLIAQQVSP